MKKEASQNSKWQLLRLGEVVREFISGGTPNTKILEFWSGSIPWITGADVSDGKVINGRRFISEAAVANSATNTAPKDSILLVTRTGVGKMAVAEELTAISQDLTALVLNDGFLPRFVFWSMIHRSHILKTLQRGSTIKGVLRKDVEQLELLIPPIEEQAGIADILDTWQHAAEKLELLVAAKTKIKHGLMQHLLAGQVRFNGFKSEHWRTVRLGELLEERDRYVNWSDDVAYQFASIRRRSGGLFDRGTFYGREVKTKVLKSLNAGDFVISKRQVVHGAWAMVTKPFDGFGVSDEYDVLVNRDPKVLDMRFFNYLSQTRWLWHLAYLASNGVHIEKLIFDFDDFAKEKVKIPPTVEEQAMIVDVLSGCDEEIRLLEKQLEALKEQKRGLMQKLLTGEVRVKL